MSRPIYIHGVAHELGELVSIDEIPALQAVPDELETLKQLGIECFSQAKVSAPMLALASARRTLAQANLAPEDVDAVVYATTTFWEERDYRPILRQFFHDLGIARAFPLCVFGSECSNVMSALATARALLLAQDLRNVLVVTSDCAAPGRRVMGGLASVFSDGAASFLIGTEPSQFRVDSLALHHSPTMWDVELENNVMAFLRGTVTGAMRAVSNCCAQAKTDVADLDLILTGNYNESVLKTLQFSIKWRRERHFRDNVARFAHSFSADTLINLVDCYETRLPVGARALLLGTGHSTWGALAITRLR